MLLSSITIGLGWPLCRSCRDYCSVLTAIFTQLTSLWTWIFRPNVVTWPFQNYHDKQKSIITWFSGQGHHKAQCGCNFYLVSCWSVFPMLLGGKSASCQLSNLFTWATAQSTHHCSKAFLQRPWPLCRGTRRAQFCLHHYGGYRNAQAFTLWSKRHGKFRPHDQSSSCIEVVSCEMHAWIYTLP